MFKGISHLGMWACTWIAFWHGAQMNGGSGDDFVTVLFWLIFGFTMWFVAEPQKQSGPRGS
jgi:hypothetical protein